MNFSSISHSSLCTVISTVPPPQSKTIITLFLIICYLTVDSASYRHWIEAPSGSRHSNRFCELMVSTSPASTAAFRMKFLCYSLHKAGTVRTHLIFAAIILPTCSRSFCMACSLMNLKVAEMTLKSSIYLPSTDLAILFMWRRCILYWNNAKVYILEKHGSVTIFNDFSILLKCIDSKLKEIAFIIEENGGGGFLIITTITWIKDLDSYFAILIKMFRSNCISTILDKNHTQRHQFRNQSRPHG